MVLEQAAAVLPGNLLEMQMIGTHPRVTESETLVVGPSICFNRFSW